MTPLDVEREMVELNNRLDEAPLVIKEHHERVRAARAAHKKAFALAYQAAEGTAMDRKLAAELATEPELAAMDFAEIEYKFVMDTFDSLRTKLRALQSVASLMKASMFGPQGGI
ncbi:hypothetical protein MINTM005_13680 [Mycobacterium intracellulare]|nr:hypothetical protein MINTM005_13680 [Mycobacterium intracellulare]